MRRILSTNKRNMLAGVISAACLMLGSPAFATNGYFTLGYSANDKGTAGASIARGTDSLIIATNPAGLMQVSDRFDLGVAFFNPNREYSVEGAPSLPNGFGPVIGGFPGCDNPGASACQIPFSIGEQSIDSSRSLFIIPNFGYTTTLSEKSKLGIAVYANGGMNTEFRGGTANVFDPQTNTIVTREGTLGGGRTGVDLSQVFLNVSYAYQLTGNLDVGIGLVGAVQRFEAYGLSAFSNVSTRPEQLTDNGHDYSYGLGLKLGATYHINDSLSVAASYQTEQKMSEFDDYAGLFAENGDFDIPATFIAGLAWKTAPNQTFLMDYQAIYYEDVAAVGNSVAPLVNGQCLDALNNGLFNGSFSANGPGCLGGENGAGFGWNDMHVVKLGYEWRFGDDTYRIGFSHTEQPIDTDQINFNLLAPGVIEQHFTAGYSTMIAEREWSFYTIYSPSEEVTGQSLFDPNQTINIKMHQFELGFSVAF